MWSFPRVFSLHSNHDLEYSSLLDKLPETLCHSILKASFMELRALPIDGCMAPSFSILRLQESLPQRRFSQSSEIVSSPPPPIIPTLFLRVFTVFNTIWKNLIASLLSVSLLSQAVTSMEAVVLSAHNFILSLENCTWHIIVQIRRNK